MMVPDHEVCQELSRGDWFVLYRGRCRKDGTPVLLKMPRSDPASPLAVRLLEHEYELLQGLSLSGVVRVHELLRDDRGCCLVLEDRGGTPLQALLAARRFDLHAFFPLALQLATTLLSYIGGTSPTTISIRAASWSTPRLAMCALPI